MVTALDALEIPLGRRDREAQLDLTAGDVPGDLEADGLEHAEHPAIVGEHDGDEALDAERTGTRRELLQEAGADPTALVLVGDRERNLRGLPVTEPHEVGDRDDLLVDRADERRGLLPVGGDQRLDQPKVDLWQAVEAAVQALLREPPEELEQGLGVLRQRRSQAQGRAVAEDHVEGLCEDGAHRTDCAARAPSARS